MQRAALGILLLLVHAAQQESGYLPSDDKEIEEPKAEFDCFSNLTVKVLFCNLTNHNARNSRNIGLTACDKELVCHKMARKGNMYSLKRIHRTQTFNICMSIQSSQTCKEYYITSIVLVDPPIKVTVTHSKLEREYSITYEEPSHLRDKLQYQIALRKENEEWPDCDTLRDSKQCRMVQYTETQIPEADLEPATKYETKVRSKPNGDYYEGRWSAWSKPGKFESQATPEEKGGNILLRTLTAIGFLIILLVCILISVFWKSRIKPIVWPEIPDHKTTLEQLCKQPRSDQQMSFNPDLFEDVHINKVDYLKAMPPTKDLFREFPDEDVPPSDMRDSLLESNQISTACINSVPMRKDGEFSSWENNDAQCTQPLNDKSHDATKGCSLVISSMISTNTSPKPYDDYNLPDTISSLLPFSKIGNSQINAENNECTALCRDKAYITIAAFQMPGSAVKQTSLCYGQ